MKLIVRTLVVTVAYVCSYACVSTRIDIIDTDIDVDDLRLTFTSGPERRSARQVEVGVGSGVVFLDNKSVFR